MINQTYEKLLALKLYKMAEIYKEQSNNQAFKDLSFDAKMALLVDEETNDKYNKMVDGIKHRSKIKMPNASLSDIHYYPDRELDKELMVKLVTGNYIEDHINVIIIGATGSGKTYIASALGNNACQKGKVVKYIRLPDLLFELDQARKHGKYIAKLKAYARAQVMIIDEFLLNPTTPEQQGDILELLELRYDNTSTIIASQFTPDGWHNNLGGGAIADAILDRIISTSYTIHIKGDKSMRTRTK